MDVSFFNLPVKALGGLQGPIVSSLHGQADGSFLCGLLFANPSLFRIRISGKELHFEDLKLENELGSDLLGVVGGLRANTSGDTAFTALHKGMLPDLLQNLAGGSILKLSGEALADFLVNCDGGMGFKLRHSVVQITNKELILRRVKEPGALLDVAHIGDFIFGLAGHSIWREPYLNSEKRETLRKDLGFNRTFHRDYDGNFWFVGENCRIQRMGQTDNKSRLTVLKIPEDCLEVSASTETEGWIYASTMSSRELYRIRKNPLSLEEEIQKVHGFGGKITGLLALDRETDPLLIIAVEGEASVEIYGIDLVKPEDPELPPPAKAPRLLGRIEGINSISSLTRDPSDKDGNTFWAGESYLGSAKKLDQAPRLVRVRV